MDESVECSGYTDHQAAKDTVSSTSLHPTIAVTLSSLLKFKDEIEERWFKTFQTDIAGELAGIQDAPFWRGFLLCKPAIRING
jgi:hypothetical protein